MGAFKPLKKSDVYVVPYIANKQWNFSGSEANLQSSDIWIYVAYPYTTPIFNPSGSVDILYKKNNQFPRLIANQIKQLYYSNFLSGSSTPTSSYGTSSRNYAIEELGYFNNFDQSTLKTYRLITSSSTDPFSILSIPQKYYGSKILPNTFAFSGSYLFFASTVPFNITDDGEGNLYDSASNSYVGNILYSHGIVTLTNPNNALKFLGISTSTPVIEKLSFKGEHIIYENEIRCLVREDEFNFTQNPTATTYSGSYNNNVTGSDFSPYVTTIGLYNEANELLAVGKFAKPIPMSPSTDMTFVIKYDT